MYSIEPGPKGEGSGKLEVDVSGLDKHKKADKVEAAVVEEISKTVPKYEHSDDVYFKLRTNTPEGTLREAKEIIFARTGKTLEVTGWDD